jgi:hypothetical protein
MEYKINPISSFGSRGLEIAYQLDSGKQIASVKLIEREPGRFDVSFMVWSASAGEWVDGWEPCDLPREKRTLWAAHRQAMTYVRRKEICAV